MKPVGYKDFVRDDGYKDRQNMKQLVEKMNKFINEGERPLLPVNVETHHTGEGEFFLRLWYREGWEI